MKYFLSLMLLCVISSIIVVSISWPDDKLHIIMCDVGQGDALLFSIGFQQLLIDTGPNQKILECLEKHLPMWDKQIEGVVITHDDADHAAGLLQIAPNYRIMTLFRNQPWVPTELSNQLNNLEKNYQMERRSLTQGQKISLNLTKEDVVFTVIWPEKKFLNEFVKPETKLNPNVILPKYVKDLDNDLSISGIVKYGSTGLFAAGDLGSQVELSLIDGGLTNDVSIIKVSHHGSNSSTDEGFIKTLRPEIALIGVGENNRYRHPSTRVIDLLRYSNIKTFQTAQHGTIEILATPDHYTIITPQEK